MNKADLEEIKKSVTDTVENSLEYLKAQFVHDIMEGIEDDLGLEDPEDEDDDSESEK